MATKVDISKPFTELTEFENEAIVILKDCINDVNSVVGHLKKVVKIPLPQDFPPERLNLNIYWELWNHYQNNGRYFFDVCGNTIVLIRRTRER